MGKLHVQDSEFHGFVFGSSLMLNAGCFLSLSLSFRRYLQQQAAAGMPEPRSRIFTVDGDPVLLGDGDAPWSPFNLVGHAFQECRLL